MNQANFTPLVLALLALVNVVGFITRYVINAVEPVLKNEFSLSNTSSGLLLSAFVAGYVVSSPLFGFLGDNKKRPRLMALGVALWSIGTALGAVSSSFELFFASRVLVGVGEAAFCTLAPGYLKDAVKEPPLLAKAFGLFYGAIPVGAALGFVLGGYLTVLWSWHGAFYVVAACGVPAALWLLSLSESRPAETFQNVSVPVEPLKKNLARIFSVKILWFAVGGYILQAFALNGVAAFLVRHGISSLNFDYTAMNNYFGGILLVAGIVGTLVGSKLSAKLAAQHPEDPLAAMLRFVGVVTLVGTPILGAALYTDSQLLFLGLCFFAELFLFAATAPVNAVIVSAAPAKLENLTQGVTILLLNVLGTMSAPYIIGKVTDLLLHSFGDARSLAISLQLSTAAMFAAGIVWFLGGSTKAPFSQKSDS